MWAGYAGPNNSLIAVRVGADLEADWVGWCLTYQGDRGINEGRRKRKETRERERTKKKERESWGSGKWWRGRYWIFGSECQTIAEVLKVKVDLRPEFQRQGQEGSNRDQARLLLRILLD